MSDVLGRPPRPAARATFLSSGLDSGQEAPSSISLELRRTVELVIRRLVWPQLHPQRNVHLWLGANTQAGPDDPTLRRERLLRVAPVWWSLVFHSLATVASVAALLILVSMLTGCRKTPTTSQDWARHVESVVVRGDERGPLCQTTERTRLKLVMDHRGPTAALRGLVRVPLAPGVLGISLEVSDNTPSLDGATGQIRLLDRGASDLKRPGTDERSSPLIWDVEVGGRATSLDLPLSRDAGAAWLLLEISPPTQRRWPWDPAPCPKSGCEVLVSTTGAFGAGPPLEKALRTSSADLMILERALVTQRAPSQKIGVDTSAMATRFASDSPCRTQDVAAALTAVSEALELLNGWVIERYGGDRPSFTDTAPVLDAFTRADALLASLPIEEARVGSGWTGLTAAPLVKLHLELSRQLDESGLPSDEREAAARWLSQALARSAETWDRQRAALPALRDVEDAQARVAFTEQVISSGIGIPVPGSTWTFSLPDGWSAPALGTLCYGPKSHLPVPSSEEATQALSRWLLGGTGALRVENVDTLAAAFDTWDIATKLLCVVAVDARPLGDDLRARIRPPAQPGPNGVTQPRGIATLRGAMETIGSSRVQSEPDHPISKAVRQQVTDVICETFDEDTLSKRIRSLPDLGDFLADTSELWSFLPDSFACATGPLSGRTTAEQAEDLFQKLVEDSLTRNGPRKTAEEVSALLSRDSAQSENSKFNPSFVFLGGEPLLSNYENSCNDGLCAELNKVCSAEGSPFKDAAMCQRACRSITFPTSVAYEAPPPGEEVQVGPLRCMKGRDFKIAITVDHRSGGSLFVLSREKFRLGDREITYRAPHIYLGPTYHAWRDIGPFERNFYITIRPSVDGQVFWIETARTLER